MNAIRFLRERVGSRGQITSHSTLGSHTCSRREQRGGDEVGNTKDADDERIRNERVVDFQLMTFSCTAPLGTQRDAWSSFVRIGGTK